MTDSDPAPETTEPVNPPEESAPAPIDLAAEAGEAAAATPPTEQKLRSLDDLDLDGAVRGQIESYVSKAVNDAVSKNDARQQKKLDQEGYMNRGQIEDLLVQKDAEHQRREQAKETFLMVLGSEGIHPGSDDYNKIQSTYRDSVDAGALTPEILLNEAGIRTLVAMSGVSKYASEAAAPQSGLSRSAPAPDGSVQFADGTVQLNARGENDIETLDDRARRAIEGAINS
jgi:hypothetical protein